VAAGGKGDICRVLIAFRLLFKERREWRTMVAVAIKVALVGSVKYAFRVVFTGERRANDR
jgi:hypothetical protein